VWRLTLPPAIQRLTAEESRRCAHYRITLIGMLRRKKFEGIKPEEEKTWYLQILFVFSLLMFFFGVGGALYGIWLGFVLLVLGSIGIVVLFRELLDRSGS
jgi:hypothetical protein